MLINFQFALVLVLVLALGGGVVLFLARRRVPGRLYDVKPYFPETSSATLIGDSDWHTLTQREMQVARRVSEGASNKQAAEALGIRPHTVGAHLKSIYRKMNLQSRTQLAVRLRDIDE